PSCRNIATAQFERPSSTHRFFTSATNTSLFLSLSSVAIESSPHLQRQYLAHIRIPHSLLVLAILLFNSLGATPTSLPSSPKRACRPRLHTQPLVFLHNYFN